MIRRKLHHKYSLTTVTTTIISKRKKNREKLHICGSEFSKIEREMLYDRPKTQDSSHSFRNCINVEKNETNFSFLSEISLSFFPSYSIRLFLFLSVFILNSISLHFQPILVNSFSYVRIAEATGFKICNRKKQPTTKEMLIDTMQYKMQ